MNSIKCKSIILALLFLFTIEPVSAQLEKKLDSLFVIASSGEVRFRDQNGPAMDSIATYGEAAVPFLIEKFNTKSARERWTVIWTLQRIGSIAVPLLVDALNRDDYWIVQRVCWALGEIKDTSATLPLINMINHPRWHVRERTATAFGKIKDNRANETVLQLTFDSNEQVRKSAAVACGRLNISDAAARLISMLDDDFYGVRMTAIDALLKLDTAIVLQTVRDSIESAISMEGDQCCYLLGKIGNGEALEILYSQTNSGNSSRRAAASRAIFSADPADDRGYHEIILRNESDRFLKLQLESFKRSILTGK